MENIMAVTSETLELSEATTAFWIIKSVWEGQLDADMSVETALRHLRLIRDNISPRLALAGRIDKLRDDICENAPDPYAAQQIPSQLPTG
jgi:hypothetical protein